MSRIDELTSAQAAMLGPVRDEWLHVGLSCEPADRVAAEDGVRQAYRRAGLDEPQIFVWLDSPMAGCIGAAKLSQVRDQVGDQVRDQVWDQVWNQVGDQVWNQVWDQVWNQVGDQVWNQVGDQVWNQVRDQVWNQVGNQVWNQVGNQVRDQVRDQVWNQVGDQVWDQVGRSIWGQHDAGWLSWVDAMTRIGVQTDASGLMAVARSAGWWWALRGCAVLTDRPSHIHRDTRHRLHHETGPAMAYRDGWGIYAWHGTRVPADMITTTWTVQRILTEPNAEVRRCAIERRGWDRFITEAGLQLVASAPDPGNTPFELHLYDLPAALREMYGEPARILLCTNGTVERDGTRRLFGLPVPAHHHDPIAAAADLYGWSVEDYRRLACRR